MTYISYLELSGNIKTNTLNVSGGNGGDGGDGVGAGTGGAGGNGAHGGMIQEIDLSTNQVFSVEGNPFFSGGIGGNASGINGGVSGSGESIKADL